jgi:hypothetical protein
MRKPTTTMLWRKRMARLLLNNPLFSNIPIPGGLVRTAERTPSTRAMLRNEDTAVGIHTTI